jgi:type II secretory pathway component PulF
MPRSDIEPRSAGVAVWLMGFSAAAVCVVASAGLLWLLWRYVPTQAALLAGLEAPLPLPARVVIAASAWTVRLLPLLILLGVPLVALAFLGGALLAYRQRAMRRFASLAAALAFAVALAEILASFIVVYSLHAALQQAGP